MLKTLYIACKYDYGKPELGFSFEHYNLYDSLVKMNKGSNKVIYFPFDVIIRKVGRDEMNRRLLETVNKEKPDLCLFFLFEDEFKKETVKEITQKSGAITINWFADDRWRFDNYSKHWAPCFNWVITNEPTAVKKYHKIGYKNVIDKQFACNHFLYKPLNLPKIYDVAFVGQPHGNRKKIIEKTKKAGLKIECFGRGWPKGKVSQEKMIRIFSQSRINLNLTRCSGKINLKSVAKIFLNKKKHEKSIKLNNPKEWLDNFKTLLARQTNELKGRNFEIPGCGGFLLTNYAEGLENYYEIGKEVVCWKNSKDLIDKIKYYLKHEKEREGIAKVGFERTLCDHTYEKRFNEIFKIIGLPR